MRIHNDLLNVRPNSVMDKALHVQTRNLFHFFTALPLKMGSSFQLEYAKDYTDGIHLHAEHRQTHKYSEKRSNRRAKYATCRMIHDGIAKGWKSGKGHGKTHLANRCADGTECPRRGHQMNRRSGFVIMRYD